MDRCSSKPVPSWPEGHEFDFSKIASLSAEITLRTSKPFPAQTEASCTRCASFKLLSMQYCSNLRAKCEPPPPPTQINTFAWASMVRQTCGPVLTLFIIRLHFVFLVIKATRFSYGCQLWQWGCGSTFKICTMSFEIFFKFKKIQNYFSFFLFDWVERTEKKLKFCTLTLICDFFS